MKMVCCLSTGLWLALCGPGFAAGGGAGAGGAGAQRTINSGLPPGEPGPPGAPNNRHPEARQPPAPHHGSPRHEPAGQDR